MPAARVVDVAAIVDAARLRPVSAVTLALCLLIATCDGFDNQGARLHRAGHGPGLGHADGGVRAGVQRRAVRVADRLDAVRHPGRPFRPPPPADRERRRVRRRHAADAVRARPRAVDAGALPGRPRHRRRAERGGGPRGRDRAGAAPAKLHRLDADRRAARGASWAASSARPLLPRFGWPSVYYLGGGVTLAVLLAAIIWLPESNRFLALRPASRRGWPG